MWYYLPLKPYSEECIFMIYATLQYPTSSNEALASNPESCFFNIADTSAGLTSAIFITYYSVFILKFNYILLLNSLFIFVSLLAILALY